MFWILKKHRPLNKAQSVAIAIECAKLALPEWTAKYPNDYRPRMAIDAAKNWLANPTKENASAADSAAASAAASAAVRAADLGLTKGGGA